MKVFKNMKQVIIASAAFLLISSSVIMGNEVNADVDCVNKYMGSYYDSTTGCTYFQYFDTYSQWVAFKNSSAPTVNWVYGGYHTYCGPLVSATCPGGPIGF